MIKINGKSTQFSLHSMPIVLSIRNRTIESEKKNNKKLSSVERRNPKVPYCILNVSKGYGCASASIQCKFASPFKFIECMIHLGRIFSTRIDEFAIAHIKWRRPLFFLLSVARFDKLSDRFVVKFCVHTNVWLRHIHCAGEMAQFLYDVDVKWSHTPQM